MKKVCRVTKHKVTPMGIIFYIALFLNTFKRLDCSLEFSNGNVLVV